MNETVSSHNSSLREKVLEHIFIGDLLRCLWRRNIHSVEVLRAEVDSGGYDLVLEYGELVRHIQLKATHDKGKRAGVEVNLRLMNKIGGCVLWLWYEPSTMELTKFLWFGGKPNEKLPDLGSKVGKHSKGNSKGHKAERPNIRVVGKGRFRRLASMDEVAEALFENAA